MTNEKKRSWTGWACISKKGFFYAWFSKEIAKEESTYKTQELLKNNPRIIKVRITEV
jgi:hypothetical protein